MVNQVAEPVALQHDLQHIDHSMQTEKATPAAVKEETPMDPWERSELKRKQVRFRYQDEGRAPNVVEKFFYWCEKKTGPSPFWKEACNVFTCPYAWFIYFVASFDALMKLVVSLSQPFKRFPVFCFPIPMDERGWNFNIFRPKFVTFIFDYQENRGHLFGTTMPQAGPLRGARATVHLFATTVMGITLIRCAHEARTRSGRRRAVEAVMLLIAGSLGNLWDRTILGHVVDYITMSFPPGVMLPNVGNEFCFNLTDVVILGLLATAIVSTLTELAGEGDDPGVLSYFLSPPVTPDTSHEQSADSAAIDQEENLAFEEEHKAELARRQAQFLLRSIELEEEQDGSSDSELVENGSWEIDAKGNLNEHSLEESTLVQNDMSLQQNSCWSEDSNH